MLTKRQRLRQLRKRLFLRAVGRKGQANPVFVVGTQRSGTNMFANVLDRSFQTECYHDNDDAAFCNYILKDEATIAKLVRDSRAKAVVFKPICDSQNATRLLKLHPRAQAIWIYRHYFDVVNSSLQQFREHRAYLHHMLYDRQKAGWRVENVLPEDMELVERFYHAGVSDASARALIWYLRNTLYFQQQLEQDDRVLLVNYERLVTHPCERFRRVFDFVGLEYRDRWVRSVFGSSVGKAEHPKIDPEIHRLCERIYLDLEANLQKSER